jgi:acyl transferase domain-containing protein
MDTRDEDLARREAPDRGDAIAIVGIGCRLPGSVHSPRELWNNLEAGVISIQPFGDERWTLSEYLDPAPGSGKTHAMVAGLLDDVTSFDAALFSLSPREARTIDPQQRLVLEVAWSALEDAGMAPSSLMDTDTGIFVGAGAVDHSARVLNPERPMEIDSYSATSALASVIAGRLAYVLGTHGPCMVTDTACSSSLVAVHLACQSLREGGCSIALAGGVNVISSPALSVALSHMNAISASGRCAAFDASADGFCRGEGAGIVVLKRLGDALAAGDRIYGVVRASEINHDGRSNGLTAPNPVAQERLLAGALRRAKLEPSSVSYLEAHGTGTLLGDPIEIRAASAAYAPGRTEPLWVGSLKSNIGHLESAAGIAGLIKALLVLQHRAIPPQAQLQTPNPHIDWEALNVRPPRERISLAGLSQPLRVAVSSFGFSGTNAHVIIEESPAPEPPPPADASDELLVVSGPNDAVLDARIADLIEHLETSEPSALRSTAKTLALGRDQQGHRLGIVADSTPAFLAGLRDARAGRSAGHVHRGQSKSSSKLCFAFVGQGAQRPGMGRELAARHPAFKSALDRCADAFRTIAGEDLYSIMWREQVEPHPIHETRFAQPALFAFEFAMAALLEAYGIMPRAVVGHSIGEVVGACVAGALGMEQGMQIAVVRGELMQSVREPGAMFAVNASAATAERWLSDLGGGRVQIAAINGPESIVISGARAAVEEVAAEAERHGFRAAKLRVSHAFHSTLMESVAPELVERLRGISPRRGTAAILSTVTGDWMDPTALTVEHFRAQLVGPVLFDPAIRRLAQRGEYSIVEIGPQPHLTAILKSQPEFASALPTCRGAGTEHRSLLQALAALYVGGASVHWPAVFGDARTPKVDLPKYPFQREPYPFSAMPRRSLALATEARALPKHPLLGRALPCAAKHTSVFETTVDAERYSFLHDHRIEGAVVLPGVVYLSLAEALVTECTGHPPAQLTNVRYHRVLVVPDNGQRTLRLTLEGSDRQRLSFRVEARDAFDVEAWLLHADGWVECTAGARLPVGMGAEQ